MAEPSDPFERRLYESFVRLGLTESAAVIAAGGRNPASANDPFERQVERFRELGLSEAEAKRAAAGRDPVRQPATAEPPAPGSPESADSLLALRFRAVEEARRLSAEARRPGLSDAGRAELLEAAVKLLEAALHTGKPGQAQRPVAKPAAARPARRIKLTESGKIVRRLP